MAKKLKKQKANKTEQKPIGGQTEKAGFVPQKSEKKGW